jgi:hypothetical protein
MTLHGSNISVAQAGCFAGNRHAYRRNEEANQRKIAKQREFRKKYPLR